MPVLTKLDLSFQRISAKLPSRTFWGKVQVHIFVIDEANKLSALMKDPDGQDALTNLFKWMVLNTKEINRFHALLVSSDSFFSLMGSRLHRELQICKDKCPICKMKWEDDYDQDSEWLECDCKQWLHEICIDYDIYDPYLCPDCVKNQ